MGDPTMVSGAAGGAPPGGGTSETSDHAGAGVARRPTPPNVLYVIDSLQPAGAEVSLLAMAPHLMAAGIGLEVVHFGREAGLGPQFEALGVPVLRLDAGRGLGRVRAVHRLVRARRPDLVHTTLFQADIAGRVAGRIARVPVVSSLVNTAYGSEHRAASGIPRWKLEGARGLDTATARLVTRFHAISRTVAAEMGTRLRIPAGRIDVVPRGREPADLGRRDAARRTSVRAGLGIGEETPVLLTASRHEPQKALDVAIEAFAALRLQRPEAHLLMAGREGSTTGRVRAAIANASLEESVDVLGWRADVPDLLAAADVLLFPSRWEGLGSVLLEAMALEVPIVASDLPVVRELLVDDDGAELAWFAPVGDARALAGACLEALELATDRPKRARDRFLRTYTAEAAALGVADIYRRTLET
jgi:glycosyltransferase involved in cell wall biosynthesis